MNPWWIEKITLIVVMFIFCMDSVMAFRDGSTLKGVCYVCTAMGVGSVLHTLCRLHWLADFEFKLNNAGLLPK